MNKDKDEDLIRIQLTITPKHLKELEIIMLEADIPTKKELFTLIFGLFRWAAKESRIGRVIASVDEEKKSYKKLAAPALKKLARKWN